MATYAQQVNSGKDSSGGNSNHGHVGNSNANMSSSALPSNSANDYSKKEEFRKYLERTGVLDALTKTLVGLYEEPERPANAIEYIKRYIGAPQHVDVDGLKRENEQLKAELEKLRVASGGSGGGNHKKGIAGSLAGASVPGGAPHTGSYPKTSPIAHAGGANKDGNKSTTAGNATSTSA